MATRLIRPETRKRQKLQLVKETLKDLAPRSVTAVKGGNLAGSTDGRVQSGWDTNAAANYSYRISY